MSFNLSGRYSDINNMNLFGNDSFHIVPINFNVVYDNVQVINGHGELSYQESEDVRFILSADYNHYKPTTQQYAWYKPGMDAKLTWIYKIDEHFTLKADVFVLADRYGLTFSNTDSAVAVKLQTIADFNLGVQYHYTKALSFFINLNNISSQQYQIWYQYPSQGINVLGGFSYAF
jgi:predicted class III extradiol MEMO1 family dioxygenase